MTADETVLEGKLLRALERLRGGQRIEIVLVTHEGDKTDVGWCGVEERAPRVIGFLEIAKAGVLEFWRRGK